MGFSVPLARALFTKLMVLWMLLCIKTSQIRLYYHVPDVTCRKNGFFNRIMIASTYRLLQHFFSLKKINAMRWSSQSLDLNLIEHLQEVLYRCIKLIKIKNFLDKFDLLAKEWAAIDQSTITHSLIQCLEGVKLR